MPSISQDKLNELTLDVDRAGAKYRAELVRSEAALAQVAAFDVILDKIGRAARGLPLFEDRNRGYGGQYLGAIDQGHRCQPPSADELLREQVNTLNERIVGLESRLAAVVAVTEFARVHKS